VTVISFFVKVPVLSVQITSTDQRVSIEESLLTSTFFLTNLFTQSHKDIVTTAGNHSGIAATANATAVRSASAICKFLIKTYVRKIIIQIHMVIAHSDLLNPSSFFSRFVAFSVVSCIISAILPI
jgi:hypothetical protein